MAESNYMSEMVSELKRYVDLRADEVKLKTTRSLSAALGQVCTFLVIIAVVMIILSLLAYALLQWINSLIGAPWGTLTVCGLFVILLIVIIARSRSLFMGSFVKLFTDLGSAQELDRAITDVASDISAQEGRIQDKASSLRSSLTPAGIAAGFIKRHSTSYDWAGLTLKVIQNLRQALQPEKSEE